MNSYNRVQFGTITETSLNNDMETRIPTRVALRLIIILKGVHSRMLQETYTYTSPENLWFLILEYLINTSSNFRINSGELHKGNLLLHCLQMDYTQKIHCSSTLIRFWQCKYGGYITPTGPKKRRSTKTLENPVRYHSFLLLLQYSFEIGVITTTVPLLWRNILLIIELKFVSLNWSWCCIFLTFPFTSANCRLSTASIVAIRINYGLWQLPNLPDSHKHWKSNASPTRCLSHFRRSNTLNTNPSLWRVPGILFTHNNNKIVRSFPVSDNRLLPSGSTQFIRGVLTDVRGSSNNRLKHAINSAGEKIDWVNSGFFTKNWTQAFDESTARWLITNSVQVDGEAQNILCSSTQKQGCDWEHLKRDMKTPGHKEGTLLDKTETNRFWRLLVRYPCRCAGLAKMLPTSEGFLEEWWSSWRCSRSNDTNFCIASLDGWPFSQPTST